MRRDAGLFVVAFVVGFVLVLAWLTLVDVFAVRPGEFAKLVAR